MLGSHADVIPVQAYLTTCCLLLASMSLISLIALFLLFLLFFFLPLAPCILTKLNSARLLHSSLLSPHRLRRMSVSSPRLYDSPVLSLRRLWHSLSTGSNIDIAFFIFYIFSLSLLLFLSCSPSFSSSFQHRLDELLLSSFCSSFSSLSPSFHFFLLFFFFFSSFFFPSIPFFPFCTYARQLSSDARLIPLFLLSFYLFLFLPQLASHADVHVRSEDTELCCLTLNCEGCLE